MIALTAFLLLAHGGISENSLTILAEDSKWSDFKIDAVSWNGRWIVGRIGKPQNAQFWLVGDKRFTELRPLEGRHTRVTGVRDDGVVVAMMVDMSVGSGRNRVVTVQDGNLALVGDDKIGTAGVGMTPTGISHEGHILGYELETGTFPRVRYFDFDGRSAKTITFFKSYSQAGVILDKTASGYVVTMPLRDNGAGRVEPEGTGFLNGSLFQPLRTQKGTLMPTSWSSDGAYVVTEFRNLWFRGQFQGEMISQKFKQAFSARSIADGGSLAVGHGSRDDRMFAAVWTRDGAVTLPEYLSAQKLTVPQGLSFIDLAYISPEGSFVVGTARNEKGYVKPFRLQLSVGDSKPEKIGDFLHER